MKNLTLTHWLLMFAVAFISTGFTNETYATNNDVNKAISEVEQIVKSAQQQQYDVLAFEEFAKGHAFLNDAKHGIKEDFLAETILESAANARVTFLNAIKIAKTKKSSAVRILKDREAVLMVGVRKSNALVKVLTEIDEELVSETDQFRESIDPDEFSEIQKRYYRLETRAIQFNALNSAKKLIDQADDDDADDLAPKSLNNALLDYKTAMNKIDLSPRNPAIYKKSVEDANVSAKHLFDVMNVIKGAEGTPEQIAVQIVKQNRALGELSSNVGKLEANLKSTKQTLQEKDTALKQVDSVLKQKDTALKEKDSALKQTESALKQKDSELKQKEGVLKSQEEQLARASTQVRFQQAMDEARKVIPETEALVYQQGKKLVFRLKRVNFRSGTAIIPDFSKLLITKVDSIIKKLDAKKVIVQGHTDSVGTASINKKLSTERATAVAKYLFQLRGGYKITYAGYGESHPIAPNETAEGRATNRRVDLVVSVKE